MVMVDGNFTKKKLATVCWSSEFGGSLTILGNSQAWEPLAPEAEVEPEGVLDEVCSAWRTWEAGLRGWAGRLLDS